MLPEGREERETAQAYTEISGECGDTVNSLPFCSYSLRLRRETLDQDCHFE